ncbi:MAG TPA: hypothetical protein VI814_07155 [Candidatus Limnocylindria bacterium]
MIGRVVLAAHQLKSIGAGQRYLMERRWLDDGTVEQRINEGTPEGAQEWKKIGRWRDLASERAAIASQGWELDR